MPSSSDGYFFEHVLTREAAYRALLDKNRRALHGLAADSLAGLIKPGSIDEWNLLPHLIEHLTLAGRHAEAHTRCCELLFVAASNGSREVFEQYEHEAETQLILAHPAAGPVQTSAALELARGERIYLTMDYLAARPVLELSHALAQADADKLNASRALRRLAALDMQRGELDRAEARIKQSLTLAEAMQDSSGISGALSQLGLLRMRYERRYDEAEEFFRQALEVAQRSGSLRSETVALNNYGILLQENMGQPQAAIECYQRALAINRALENRAGEAVNSDNLGGMYVDLGRLAESIELLRLSVQRYGEVGDTPGVGSAGAKLGLALLRQGDLAGARQELERGLAILQELDEAFWQGYAESYMGSLCLAEGKPDEAHSWFEGCRRSGVAIAEPQLASEAALGLARCALVRQDRDAALAEIEHARQAAASSGNQQSVAESWLLEVRVHLTQAHQAGNDEQATIARRLASSALAEAERVMAALALPLESTWSCELAKLQLELQAP